jgi:hypothetical protein
MKRDLVVNCPHCQHRRKLSVNGIGRKLKKVVRCLNHACGKMFRLLSIGFGIRRNPRVTHPTQHVATVSLDKQAFEPTVPSFGSRRKSRASGRILQQMFVRPPHLYLPASASFCS